MSSRTSTEPAVAGYEVESFLGDGPRGSVFIATQVGLQRRVALKLYRPPDGGPVASIAPWPEHPGVARLHAAGISVGGSFTAAQLAAGGSLAARLAVGNITREEALALCDQVAETLSAIGVAHGALGPGNVLIDAERRALLCDFGMPGVEATADADAAALGALRERCALLPSRVTRRRRRGAARAAAAVAAGVVAVVATAGDGREPITPPLAGTTVLGSALAREPLTTAGCDGRPPNGSAPGCTLVQLRTDGPHAAFAADGVIRRWSLRAAQGDVVLQVIRADGRGRYVTAAASQRQTASGRVDTFTTDLPVRRGDLPAIRLLPGAGIGVAPGVPGAVTRAFMGALYYAPPRHPQATAGTALEGELAVRIEYFPGRTPRPVPSLARAAARGAPAGRRLAAGEVEFPDLRARTEAVVLLDGEVAIDLLRGSTRLQRITVVGADPRGTLSAFVPQSRGAPGPYIIWRNPDGREIVHHYRASASGLTAVD